LTRNVACLALILVASLGVAVPSAAAATAPADPKVVIIVGATQGTTTEYRTSADVAYAEALRHTSNVIRIYSPNATWTRVKAAVAGASIVVYLGHGNGWPSPYTYDPLFTTKDGFGLNATAGAGDSNTKYYGEPSIATLGLAPGAVVILNRLCYASGNSEPGLAEPTVTVARQRADNYAVGFLKAGAAAVIADGHGSADTYIRSLFTTHQSVLSMWRTQRNAIGNFVSYPSVRTPGATIYQDPVTPTYGFWRSVAIAEPGVTTDDVIAGGLKATDTDPATFQFPGNAAVLGTGAPLFTGTDTASEPTTTLPAGTRLRVTEQAVSTTADGTTVPLVAVQGVDDPKITGFVLASDLAPKDGTRPAIRSLNVGTAFSPNGDGVWDTAILRGRFTESVAWKLTVKNAAAVVVLTASGSGSTFDVTWNGLVAGKAVPDGRYTVTVTGDDAWHNGATSATKSITVDTLPSQLSALTPAASTVQRFSPNGDRYRDSVALLATQSEHGSFMVRARAADGTLVRNWVVADTGGATSIGWDGRDSAGRVVPDGTYTLRVTPVDPWGNAGASAYRTVMVVAALRSVTTSRAAFYPQDGDSLAKTTSLSLTLARPMTVTWTVRNAAGAIVVTHLAAAQVPAGTQTWSFDGRAADGTMLPAGHYSAWVSATDGEVTATQAVGFDMEAFLTKPSDTTPGRGQRISVTAVTSEALSAPPRVYITQPGKTVWSVPTTKIATNTYKATFTIKTGGSSGTITFKVMGKDTGGGINRTYRSYQLH
jgi:flagellar hook assembly protein FlgD